MDTAQDSSAGHSTGPHRLAFGNGLLSSRQQVRALPRGTRPGRGRSGGRRSDRHSPLADRAPGRAGGSVAGRGLDQGSTAARADRDLARLCLLGHRKRHGQHTMVVGRLEVELSRGCGWGLASRDVGSIQSALDGQDVACDLVHSLAHADFIERDRVCARAFGGAAAAAGVSQIVYLGGLGEDDNALSPHRQPASSAATCARSVRFAAPDDRAPRMSSSTGPRSRSTGSSPWPRSSWSPCGSPALWSVRRRSMALPQSSPASAQKLSAPTGRSSEWPIFGPGSVWWR